MEGRITRRRSICMGLTKINASDLIESGENDQNLINVASKRRKSCLSSKSSLLDANETIVAEINIETSNIQNMTNAQAEVTYPDDFNSYPDPVFFHYEEDSGSNSLAADSNVTVSSVKSEEIVPIPVNIAEPIEYNPSLPKKRSGRRASVAVGSRRRKEVTLEAIEEPISIEAPQESVILQAQPVEDNVVDIANVGVRRSRRKSVLQFSVANLLSGSTNANAVSKKVRNSAERVETNIETISQGLVENSSQIPAEMPVEIPVETPVETPAESEKPTDSYTEIPAYSAEIIVESTIDAPHSFPNKITEILETHVEHAMLPPMEEVEQPAPSQSPSDNMMPSLSGGDSSEVVDNWESPHPQEESYPGKDQPDAKDKTTSDSVTPDSFEVQSNGTSESEGNDTADDFTSDGVDPSAISDESNNHATCDTTSEPLASDPSDESFSATEATESTIGSEFSESLVVPTIDAIADENPCFVSNCVEITKADADLQVIQSNEQEDSLSAKQVEGIPVNDYDEMHTNDAGEEDSKDEVHSLMMQMMMSAATPSPKNASSGGQSSGGGSGKTKYRGRSYGGRRHSLMSSSSAGKSSHSSKRLLHRDTAVLGEEEEGGDAACHSEGESAPAVVMSSASVEVVDAGRHSSAVMEGINLTEDFGSRTDSITEVNKASVSHLVEPCLEVEVDPVTPPEETGNESIANTEANQIIASDDAVAAVVDSLDEQVDSDTITRREVYNNPFAALMGTGSSSHAVETYKEEDANVESMFAEVAAPVVSVAQVVSTRRSQRNVSKLPVILESEPLADSSVLSSSLPATRKRAAAKSKTNSTDTTASAVAKAAPKPKKRKTTEEEEFDLTGHVEFEAITATNTLCNGAIGSLDELELLSQTSTTSVAPPTFRAPDSLLRSATKKSVLFGSPDAVEFSKTKPTTNLTPLSRSESKLLFSMEMKAERTVLN